VTKPAVCIPGWGKLDGPPAVLDAEPVVAIAAVILRETVPPGVAAILAPHLGSLLTPSPDRYGCEFD
jgi:hypothetical protein